MSRELQTINQQNKLALWAGRIKACRGSGQNVKEWCKENSICNQTYYRWQKTGSDQSAVLGRGCLKTKMLNRGF